MLSCMRWMYLGVALKRLWVLLERKWNETQTFDIEEEAKDVADTTIHEAADTMNDSDQNIDAGEKSEPQGK
jgi:hypothetical protein